jgi:hypothetical protein
MSTIQLSRAQRREMRKLAERVDRVAQADARFFERFPNRKHRVRLASQAELSQYKIIDWGARFFASRLSFFHCRSQRGARGSVAALRPQPGVFRNRFVGRDGARGVRLGRNGTDQEN